MSTEPKDIAFNNASKNRDHNIFTEEYYGGADTFIYIDNERYENISALSFEVRETVKPIYSYASRIFDDLAVGTRIVQGVIKIPVKNEGPVDRLTADENDGYSVLWLCVLYMAGGYIRTYGLFEKLPQAALILM